MTLENLQRLFVHAINGTRHVDAAASMNLLRVLTPQQREQAANCYAAIVGERSVPTDFGRRHALSVQTKPSKGRVQANRNAPARRVLEEMRDLE